MDIKGPSKSTKHTKSKVCLYLCTQTLPFFYCPRPRQFTDPCLCSVDVCRPTLFCFNQPASSFLWWMRYKNNVFLFQLTLKFYSYWAVLIISSPCLKVYKALVEKTKFIQGSRVENNTFTLSVHYRCVEQKVIRKTLHLVVSFIVDNKSYFLLNYLQIWNSLSELVRSVLSDYPELRLTVGRKVLEIRPSIEWDKGKALEFLLESIGN